MKQQSQTGPMPLVGTSNNNELFQRSLRMYNRGKLTETKEILQRLLAIDGDHIDAQNLLGVTLLYLEGPNDVSEQCFEYALRKQPSRAEFHSNLGTLRWGQDRLAEARECFGRAVELDPGIPRAHLNYANAQRALGDLEEAEVSYEKALQLKPVWPRVHYNLATLKAELGKWDDALRAYNRAISLRPDYAQAHFARSVLYLKLGNFEAGWRDYEWRFEARDRYYVSDIDWRWPQWQGEPFPGKTLLVYHEQGQGDVLNFIRYLPLAKARGRTILFLCAWPLLRLLEQIQCDGLVVKRMGVRHLTVEDFDLHVPLMSLATIFGGRFDKAEDVPGEVPYLEADPQLVEQWQARVRQDAFTVGLVWEGNPDQGDNSRRSCRLEDYAPLAEVPGVVFYSLQIGDEAAKQTAHPPEGMELVDLTADIHDYADTAAFIKALDLVVTVDTSVAHLAGALGHPVWTVLWLNCCWRYLVDREDSPWYPSMRLYRQPSLGDWSSVMQNVAKDLAKTVRGRRMPKRTSSETITQGPNLK